MPPREEGGKRRFEALSPGGSLVLFADSKQERDEWCWTIQQAGEGAHVVLRILI